MKTITQATENKLAKASGQYVDLLNYLLDEMKCRIGWFGATIKEMKSYDVVLANASQLNVYESNEMRGIGVKYSDYISYVGTHDLSYVNIEDFNGLVKAVLSDNREER